MFGLVLEAKVVVVVAKVWNRVGYWRASWLVISSTAACKGITGFATRNKKVVYENYRITSPNVRGIIGYRSVEEIR